MIPASKPSNEAERLAALRAYEVLDTAYEDAFDNIAHLAGRLIDTPIALISLVDADRQWFKSRIGLDGTETAREFSFCAHAINAPREVLVVPDALLDPRFSDNPLVLGEPRIRFYAGAPLTNSQGASLGALCVIDREPRTMSAETRELLRRLAETVVTTLELRRAMNGVRDLALLDSMTGLPNRLALIAAVDRAIDRQRRQGLSFALLYLDLDGFKRVNDLYGHAAGDEVLRKVAVALRAAVGPEDTAGRLGGDEFGAVLTGSGPETVLAAERVRAAIETSLAAVGHAVTASIGVVSFQSLPAHADQALALADGLMYAAKSAGRNCVRTRVV
jgi:diguanylate cyclase (GGDEF)-like protein